MKRLVFSLRSLSGGSLYYGRIYRGGQGLLKLFKNSLKVCLARSRLCHVDTAVLGHLCDEVIT